MFARKGGKSYARYRVDDSAACRSKATGAHALGWAERGSRGRRGRVLGPILLVGLMPGGDRRECVSPIRMQEAGRQNQKGAEEWMARKVATATRHASVFKDCGRFGLGPAVGRWRGCGRPEGRPGEAEGRKGLGGEGNVSRRRLSRARETALVIACGSRGTEGEAGSYRQAKASGRSTRTRVQSRQLSERLVDRRQRASFRFLRRSLSFPASSGGAS